MKQKHPFEYSYKVTDIFDAGEYPFEKMPKDGIKKLNHLIDFGIKWIINLTSEPLEKYSGFLPERGFLPEHCIYTNLPITDYTVPLFPTLKEIHSKIDEAESLLKNPSIQDKIEELALIRRKNAKRSSHYSLLTIHY